MSSHVHTPPPPCREGRVPFTLLQIRPPRCKRPFTEYLSQAGSPLRQTVPLPPLYRFGSSGHMGVSRDGPSVLCDPRITTSVRQRWDEPSYSADGKRQGQRRSGNLVQSSRQVPGRTQPPDLPAPSTIPPLPRRLEYLRCTAEPSARGRGGQEAGEQEARLPAHVALKSRPIHANQEILREAPPPPPRSRDPEVGGVVSPAPPPLAPLPGPDCARAPEPPHCARAREATGVWGPGPPGPTRCPARRGSGAAGKGRPDGLGPAPSAPVAPPPGLPSAKPERASDAGPRDAHLSGRAALAEEDARGPGLARARPAEPRAQRRRRPRFPEKRPAVTGEMK